MEYMVSGGDKGMLIFDEKEEHAFLDDFLRGVDDHNYLEKSWKNSLELRRPRSVLYQHFLEFISPGVNWHGGSVMVVLVIGCHTQSKATLLWN